MNASKLQESPERWEDKRFLGPQAEVSRHLLNEDEFAAMLRLERRRAERSNRPFVLMLLDGKHAFLDRTNGGILEQIVAAVSSSTREADILGWYEGVTILGGVLTELGDNDIKSALNSVHSRLSSALRGKLSIRQVNEIRVSFHVFPEEWEPKGGNWKADFKLYPDLPCCNEKGFLSRSVKRFIDIIGSLMAMILLSPLFVLIAAAIKITSKGPVLFRQTRVGQYGVPFTFYKFRSMHVSAASAIHEVYVKRFISGEVQAEGPAGLFKLTNDPRITPLGRFLRRTSLDELPQFYNALQGKMSLVGPRPPIEYEMEAYNPWHRRRLLEAKPGITGLWQVKGRSKTGFDDMVRLDLQYAGRQSVWLDLTILAKTVWTVVAGEGAC
jgi:lipopolysaccharide/colanic/teichoic acid biosynthesis glycosyltransferase